MKDFIKLITNRVMISIFLVLLQLAAFIALALWIPEEGSYRLIINISITIVSTVVGLHVVGGNTNPGYKISWIILILVVPVFGCFYYIFYHQWNMKKWRRKKVEELYEIRKELIPVYPQNEKNPPRTESYLNNHSFSCYSKTKTEFYPTGAKLIEAVLRKIREAKEYILVEFFIIKEGMMFENLFNELVKKAAEGVEVKLLYDDLGSQDLPVSFPKKMKKLGIEAVPFNPVRANINLSLNYRDHRKIVIIDGKYAFTGGINIGDEYNNRRKRFGYWLDCGILLEGDAVWSMIVTFFENWYFMKKEKPDYDKYKRDYEVSSEGGVLPYADSPLDDDYVSRNVLFDLINSAKKHIYLCTPYLILDNEIVTSLCNAARAKIDVRVVIPGIPDKKSAYLLTKSFSKDLLAAGVKVYTYTPGFNHAKAFIFDDETAIIGTTNLDYRSFYIHYENNVLLYNTESIKDIKTFFINLFDASALMVVDQKKRKNVFNQILRGILRVFAPQL